MIARLYSNENFPLPVVIALRELGHDVLTSLDAGKANQAIPDDEVLRFATENERAIITHNRQDLIRLHRLNPAHAGVIVCALGLELGFYPASSLSSFVASAIAVS